MTGGPLPAAALRGELGRLLLEDLLGWHDLLVDEGLELAAEFFGARVVCEIHLLPPAAPGRVRTMLPTGRYGLHATVLPWHRSRPYEAPSTSIR